MAIWLFLSVLSLTALYMSITLNRPTLIAATAVASALGIGMIVLRVSVQRRMARTIRLK